jgi:hypothetical protein
VTGGSPGPDGITEYATIKYNAAGQEQWVARYNGPGTGSNGASAVGLDSAGNIYVTGSSFGLDGTYDYATTSTTQPGKNNGSRATMALTILMIMPPRLPLID